MLICLIITGLLLSKHAPDDYGWMMLVGSSWVAGYLDCRIFSKVAERSSSKSLPLDVQNDPPEPSANKVTNDASIFR